MGVTEGEERGQVAERIFEVTIAKNFPYLMKNANKNIQLTERWTQRDPSQDIFYIIKLSKDKEKILKAVRKKQTVTYKASSRRMSSDFSSWTSETGK